MSQDEEESSFFERERDRLSREITSVSRRGHTVKSSIKIGMVHRGLKNCFRQQMC